jgi:hypothetical protein
MPPLQDLRNKAFYAAAATRLRRMEENELRLDGRRQRSVVVR